jgi:hypothetical protein
MIEDVMTFLPKPERNSIRVSSHDAPTNRVDMPERLVAIDC